MEKIESIQCTYILVISLGWKFDVHWIGIYQHKTSWLYWSTSNT